MTIPVLVVLCCWLVAGTSGQRYQQQQRQEPVAPAGKAQQQQPPYYRDALPKSAPAIPRYYPPAPVHYVDDVPAQELLPRAPQFQEESRQVETQQSPQAADVAPVPLPSKSAQEIQAEYYRSQLYAAPTVNRQQYAEPDAAAATPLPSEESPQQPLPKPKLSRPRPHRRRKRPKKTTTTTTTTEAPVEEAKSEEVSGPAEPAASAAPPQPEPSPTPQRSLPFLRPRKLERPPLAHLPPAGQRQTSVQGPPPLQPPPLDEGPPLAQFPIPDVQPRPPSLQRPPGQQQAQLQVQRALQGHGAPQVIQRQHTSQRRPPAAAAPPPVQQRQPQPARDIEVHRAPQRVFGSGQRHSQPARVPEVDRSTPAPAEPEDEPYVPPRTLIDSTHGIPGGSSFGFGQRLSARRNSQTIVAQPDQSRDPGVQAEQRPTPAPRQRSRYQTTRRSRRPTLSIESEFADPINFPVTRAPHRFSSGLSSKRRRVKVSKPAQLAQVAPEEEVTTPAPTTTTTPEPPPTTTTSVATPLTLPAVTVSSTPSLVTPLFPSAEQSFYRTHGLPPSPYNAYGVGVTAPQPAFTQPSPFTPSVAEQVTPPVTPAPRETPSPVVEQSVPPPQRPLDRPDPVVPLQRPPFRQLEQFPLPPQRQVSVLGQSPSLLPGQAPPGLNSPYPQRPVYQLPGFTPGQRLPIPQHYIPSAGTPFIPRNNTFLAQGVPVPGQGRTVPPDTVDSPPVRNRTSEAIPLPVQRFVDVPPQGGFGQQGPTFANPFSSVQPAHVFGPPGPNAPPFRGFPDQYPGAQFRGLSPPGVVDSQFQRQNPLSLPSQGGPSQTTPSQQQNTFVTEATPFTQVSDLGTTPLSLSTPSTPAEGQFVDDAGTTVQLPTPAPPSASSLSTLDDERTTTAPFEFQTPRPAIVQYQSPARPGAQFATSPALPQYQTTPRPASQFQQSLEPQQRPTVAPPQSQPSGPASPPSGQSHFRLGTPQQHQQQQQQNAIGAQPQFNSIAGVQQGYDPYQQYGGGYQLGNTLFNPAQQTSQDLSGGYQLPDSGPFQAQFGGPYQPQYSTIDGYPQYQTTSGLGDIRGSGSNQQGTVQGYRTTAPPIYDRTLLSYDIGVPLRS
ncbi:uncharacterized protein LOC144121731 isoform X2 [Amblyomma americanum]